MTIRGASMSKQTEMVSIAIELNERVAKNAAIAKWLLAVHLHLNR